MLCMAPNWAHAALDFEEVVYGRYTLSVDGGGSVAANNYDITINKPVGATVFKVHTSTTSTPSNTSDPGVSPLTFNIGGTAVTPVLSGVSTDILFGTITTRWGEVTSDLEAALNAAPAGSITINVTENTNNGALDGSALYVVWNDPTAPVSVVGLKLGAAVSRPIPQTFSIATQPINTQNPLFDAEIGLGISYSTGNAPNNVQVSRLVFEGTEISTDAGGYDDGALANGALFTVGGDNDTSDRTDSDERYQVTDLINNQETSLDIEVSGQTSDDVVFAIWFRARAAGKLILTPEDGSSSTTEPPYTGFGPAGAVVTLTWTDVNTGITQIDTVTIDPQGNWSAPPRGFVNDGEYILTASTTAPVMDSDTVTFTIDSVAPVLTLSTPADGAVTPDTTPTFSGTGEPGAPVTLEITDAQGAVVQTLTVTPDAVTGAFSVDAADLPEGAYTVTATSVDAAGNAATPVSSGFSVDTTAPTIALDAPADNSLINDPTPTVSGTAELGSVVTIEVFDDQGVLVQTFPALLDMSGAFSTDVPLALNDGTYTITATSTDLAGNTATDTHTVTIDSMPPVVVLTAPVDGSSTNDDTPTLSGTTDTMADVTITLTDAQGMVVFSATVTPANGAFSVDASALPEGTYTLDATSTDAAGNLGMATPVTFTVDVTAPALEILSPMDNALVGQRDVMVSGSSDPNQEVVVELRDAQGMVLASQTVTTDANGAWTTTFQGLNNGDYTAEAVATDAATNSTSDTVSFAVDSDDPNLTVDNPEEDASLADTTPTIDGTTDVDATITVVITDANGDVVETLTATPDAAGAWSVDPTQDLTDGTYTLSTTATRPNGRTTTIARDVTVDTTEPDVAITAPADGSITNQTDVTVTGTTEAGASVVVTVTDADGAEVFTQTVTADDQGAFEADAGTLPDGEYNVSAQATDAAGNMSDETSDFTIDTTAPTLTIESPMAGETVSDTTPTITGTADAGAQVEVFVDGASVGTVTADDQGQWSFDLTDELDEGAHTVEARTTNAAGTEATSGEVTFEVEEPGEDVVITSPTEGSDVTGPSVTVSGTGTPGEEVVVVVGGQTQTATVDDNGNWSTTVDNVPSGASTISATSDGVSVTVDVNVVDPPADDELVIVGGGCNSTTGKTNPASGLVWLLACAGCVVGLRRRRR